LSAKRVKAGSTAGQEAMLTNQAIALQTLFARLAERAMGCNEVVPFEANMRMALRAQAQSRAAIEALGTLKNPPVVYARQANFANGPQQINNGVAPAREPEIAPNKLTGDQHELLADTRAASASSTAHSPMEALGAINGTTHARGKV